MQYINICREGGGEGVQLINICQQINASIEQVDNIELSGRFKDLSHIKEICVERTMDFNAEQLDSF